VPADDAHDITPDRAVIDRLVDGATAVLLVGPDEDELLVPVGSLPAGAVAGSWVVLDLAADPAAVVEVDVELTEARRHGFETRLERLRQRRTGGRFDR
jgi:hypothetical protein